MQKKATEPTEIKVQLFIVKFKCHPDKITRILGIRPTKAWLRGDPIPQSRGGTRRVNGWTLESPTRATASPEHQVKMLLKIIKPRTKRFKKLPPGSRVDLSCAIYANDDSQRVFQFSAAAIKVLAEIGAPINVAYYCPE